ncbi:hypothetical protein RBSWK_05096 [Rhodopirellula baltica SWK14]|uniref:Uncharacterized protein n=1 Tax=Rhodopirellula baltica SWK14 TaxID=993516 RepID=L7CAH6_RHOBT|nr:hypothetical protein RBSWK_05096 [Rhodopirellula baltica SWK14]
MDPPRWSLATEMLMAQDLVPGQAQEVDRAQEAGPDQEADRRPGLHQVALTQQGVAPRQAAARPPVTMTTPRDRANLIAPSIR